MSEGETHYLAPGFKKLFACKNGGLRLGRVAQMVDACLASARPCVQSPVPTKEKNGGLMLSGLIF
jgi:hypothetical protein